jgi:hypothetical protein
MGLARATVALPEGPNPEDFERPVAAGDLVSVPDDHPLLTGGYLVPEADPDDYTRDQLVEMAEALGVDVPSRATKAEITDLIQEAETSSDPPVAATPDAE